MSSLVEYLSLNHGSTPMAQPVLAMLTRRDLERARLRAPAFAAWRDHLDFVEEREAQFFGYGTAGATACFQPVPFSAFERWARLTGARTDVFGLDDFASHWRWRKANAGAPSRGRLAAPRPADDRSVQEAGIQLVDIFPDGFARWLKALSDTPSFDRWPTLDDYAALVIETCIDLRS